MANKQNLTPEQVTELFSELDESGVVDPVRESDRVRRFRRRAAVRDAGGDKAVDELSRSERQKARARRTAIDPLSEQDPSGSKVGQAISHTAIAVIIGVLVFIVGMQVVYGVNRRLSTANLSERADYDTVTQAIRSGVEWGNGFTQFPSSFTVDAADEKMGVIEVSVVDTDSANELELLSNSQIQASALATNALLNDKINRVVYNVYALVDDNGNFQHDSFFGFMKAEGARRAILTFIWTKSVSENSSNIDWELKIIGMDDSTAEAIQKQVNSVSSLTEKPGATQGELDEDAREREYEQELHGEEVFRGGAAEKSSEDVLECK